MGHDDRGGSGVAAARPTRVLVVDDHPIVAHGTELLLAGVDDLELVGAARTRDEAVRAASRTRPDVVLLDLRMPGTSAPEVVRDLRARVPGTVVLLFTAAADPLLVRAAVDAGACGVVLKDATSDELVGAIRAAAAGQPLPGVPAAPAVGSARGRTALTDREVEVLRHVARGCSNADVAAEMGLALATVKSYLHSAMRKLGARNRVEAILRAGEQQLL